MRVPFSLRRTAAEAVVTGLLFPSEDVAGLLGVCERLGQDSPPVIYRVHGGFLLEPARPVTGAVRGAIRLGGLAEHLYIPVDAELVPPLLADEAAGLVRDRGLVFLPGGLVLGYDPARPVPAGTLLAVNRLPPRPWQPL